MHPSGGGSSHDREPSGTLDARSETLLHGESSDSSGINIGDRVAHYLIVEKLGSGGMGVVFRARDSKLGRNVALKFLGESRTRDPVAIERFRREARAAAALNHPNIVTIYEIGTAGEVVYIAMEYVDGQPLRQLMAQGPLAVDLTLKLALQIARGLEKAHEAGVVHRDLKPANIMVTRDLTAKILDFGLAKLGADEELTQPGAVMGTLRYMSPEQLEGADLDSRTDLWSLGAILYEMVTGVSPFKADSKTAVVASILHREPVPLDQVSGEVPVFLSQVTSRALEKDRTHRYQRAGDLVADLTSEQPAAARAAVRGNAIAVLPFRDLSPLGDNVHLSDGFTEEIITDLSQLESLTVISRASTDRLKDTEEEIEVLGARLGVRFLLQGSVRKAGDQLRISARLNDVVERKVVWARAYPGSLDRLFEIQETVADDVVAVLRERGAELERQASHAAARGERIDNVQAYECYLRARQQILLWTEEALSQAERHLANARELVGDHALILAAQGFLYWQYVNMGIRPAENLELSEACARRVLEALPDSGHGHRLLAMNQVLRGRAPEALMHFRRALAAAPGDPDTLLWTSLLLTWIGRTAAARPLAEKLLRIDPLTPMNHGLPGWILLMEGDFAGAVPPFLKMYELEPEAAFHALFYGLALALAGDRESALALLDRAATHGPNDAGAWLASMLRHALAGDAAAMHEAATAERLAVARGDLQYSWMVAGCHALLGETTPALDWLTNATDRGFINFPFLNELDPLLANLRGEPEFRRLMDQVEIRWGAFDA